MTLLAQVLSGLGFTDPVVSEKLLAYADQLRFYNQRLNLIARTDVGQILDHHIVHCLSLAKRGFPAEATVVDWGTGGGLPLIPLAILFPHLPFVGVDSVGKKIQAIQQIARSLELPNVEGWHGRAEAFGQTHTHSVSRATAPLETLWSWRQQNALDIPHVEAKWPAGLICLKGGDLAEEIRAVKEEGADVQVEPVGLPGAYYHDKYIVSVTS